MLFEEFIFIANRKFDTSFDQYQEQCRELQFRNILSKFLFYQENIFSSPFFRTGEIMKKTLEH